MGGLARYFFRSSKAFAASAKQIQDLDLKASPHLEEIWLGEVVDREGEDRGDPGGILALGRA